MNNKSIVLSCVALGLLAITGTLITGQKTVNEKFAEWSHERYEKAEESAKGYQQYMFNLRANQITKQINVEDVKYAWAMADQVRQTSNKTTALDAIDWTPGGPDNIGGRTRAFCPDKTNPNKLYMGQVSGGFWISNDKGNTWTQLAGNDSTQAISVTSITQAANGDIYYGTGEGMSGQPTFSEQIFIPGEGVFKSTDGGATFSQLLSTKPSNGNSNTATWAYVNSISAHPTDADKIFAATNAGVYVTTNGGATWTKPTGLNYTYKFTDVECSKQGNVVVAASANNIFISTDGGTTFGSPINTTSVGLPGTAGITRIELAIAPSDENYVYAIMNGSGSTKGCYKSTDKGASWTTIGVGGGTWDPLGDQGVYDIAFGVHPTNPEVVFAGGQLDLYRYSPQELWKPIAFWIGSNGSMVHADMHGIYFNSGNPDEMYVVTDGGFYRTLDCLEPDPYFQEKNKNYTTAQCYSVAANRLGQILFGAQDNGTNLMSLNFANSPQISSAQMGGDGMDCEMSDKNPNILIGTTQNGGLRRSTNGGIGGASYKVYYDVNIDKEFATTTSGGYGRPDEGSNWIAPLTLKEKTVQVNGKMEDRGTLLIGLNSHIWFTQKATTIGPVVWFPLITAANVGFSAVTMNDSGTVVYAGTAGGLVYRVTNINLLDTTYQYNDTLANELSKGFDMGQNIKVDLIDNRGRFITDLKCDPSGNTLLITVPNYGNSAYVYRSTNARAATPVISSIQGNLPPMPVYSAAILSGSTQKYLIGTEMGVWGTDNGGSTWTEMNNISNTDLTKWHPRVPTMEIVIKKTRENKDGSAWKGDIIYTGTHGRGTFYSTYKSQFVPVSTSDLTSNVQRMQVYPNPVINNANLVYESNYTGDATLKLFTLTGKIIENKYVQLVSGKNNIQIEMSNQPKGMYLAVLNVNGQNASAKIIKR